METEHARFDDRGVGKHKGVFLSRNRGRPDARGAADVRWNIRRWRLRRGRQRWRWLKPSIEVRLF